MIGTAELGVVYRWRWRLTQLMITCNMFGYYRQTSRRIGVNKVVTLLIFGSLILGGLLIRNTFVTELT